MKKLTYNNTPETMSLDEAVELFQPFENGESYRSYVLLESVVPKEYLDNEEFFRRIIPTRYSFTYPTLLSYGSYRIRANEKLAMMSIVKNGQLGGLYETYRLPLSEEIKKKLQENKQYIVIERKDNEIIVKSKLLEDKAFIDKLVKKLPEIESYGVSCYVGLAIYSKTFSSNDEYMMSLVSKYPGFCAYYTGKNIKAIIEKAVETMIESRHFNHYITSDFIEKQDKSVQKLLNMCKKTGELPSDARLRKIIYRQICKRYLASLKKETIEEQADDQTLN